MCVLRRQEGGVREAHQANELGGGGDVGRQQAQLHQLEEQRDRGAAEHTDRDGADEDCNEQRTRELRQRVGAVLHGTHTVFTTFTRYAYAYGRGGWSGVWVQRGTGCGLGRHSNSTHSGRRNRWHRRLARRRGH